MVHVSKITKDVVLLLHALVNNFINVMIIHAEKILKIVHQLKNVLQFHHSSVLMVPVFHIEFFVGHLIHAQIKNQLDAQISYVINHLLSVKQLKDVLKDLLNVKMGHVCMIYPIVKLNNVQFTYLSNVLMVYVSKTKNIVLINKMAVLIINLKNVLTVLVLLKINNVQLKI